jgi:hypothetical protein
MTGISLVLNEVVDVSRKMHILSVNTKVLSNKYRVLILAIVYIYTIHNSPPFLSVVYRKVREITGENISMNTVKLSLKILKNHGFVYIEGTRYKADTENDYMQLIKPVVDKLEEIKIYL